MKKTDKENARRHNRRRTNMVNQVCDNKCCNHILYFVHKSVFKHILQIFYFLLSSLGYWSPCPLYHNDNISITIRKPIFKIGKIFACLRLNCLIRSTSTIFMLLFNQANLISSNFSTTVSVRFLQLNSINDINVFKTTFPKAAEITIGSYCKN